MDKPLVFKPLVLFLDISTKLIGIFLNNKFIHIFIGVLLFLAPIFYNPELFEYYKYLHEVGFSVKNIYFAIQQFFPLPFVLLISIFVFFLILVMTIKPLLFITCLTENLEQKYGVNVLKERGCNSRLTPAGKVAIWIGYVICGQDTAGRVIVHHISTQAWQEVSTTNPYFTGAQPKYQGTFDRAAGVIGAAFEVLRGKK